MNSRINASSNKPKYRFTYKNLPITFPNGDNIKGIVRYHIESKFFFVDISFKKFHIRYSKSNNYSVAHYANLPPDFIFSVTFNCVTINF